MSPDASNSPRADSANPIIVYQMGKVGSASVHYSLEQYFRKKGITTALHHVHTLDMPADAEQLLESLRGHRPNLDDTLGSLQKSRELRQQIDENPSQRWTLISLVRDPVARNLATFFENLHEYFPDWKVMLVQDNPRMQNLVDSFLNHEDHGLPERWFDEQMKPVWDIDVYASPFPHEQGFEIFRSEKADLLLLRLESLTAVGPRALSMFLGYEDFDLLNANVSASKDYHGLYEQHKKLALPPEYVDAMYATRYARHFYSEQDIARFRRHWLASTASRVPAQDMQGIKQQLIVDLEANISHLEGEVDRLWKKIRAQKEYTRYLEEDSKRKDRGIESLKGGYLHILEADLKRKDQGIEYLGRELHAAQADNQDLGLRLTAALTALTRLRRNLFVRVLLKLALMRWPLEAAAPANSSTERAAADADQRPAD